MWIADSSVAVFTEPHAEPDHWWAGDATVEPLRAGSTSLHVSVGEVSRDFPIEVTE
jgi:hypothetical protein